MQSGPLAIYLDVALVAYNILRIHTCVVSLEYTVYIYIIRVCIFPKYGIYDTRMIVAAASESFRGILSMFVPHSSGATKDRILNLYWY